MPPSQPSSSPQRSRLVVPAELRHALARSAIDRRSWLALTPAARRMGATWIAHAKGTDVRSWRVADVIRRARRYAGGAGPFYPTKADQTLLARPRSPS